MTGLNLNDQCIRLDQIFLWLILNYHKCYNGSVILDSMSGICSISVYTVKYTRWLKPAAVDSKGGLLRWWDSPMYFLPLNNLLCLKKNEDTLRYDILVFPLTLWWYRCQIFRQICYSLHSSNSTPLLAIVSSKCCFIVFSNLISLKFCPYVFRLSCLSILFSEYRMNPRYRIKCYSKVPCEVC